MFVGDERVEDHHEIEVQDETGRRLATARLPEGIEGLSGLHTLLAAHLPEEWVDPDSGMIGGRVVVGIGTDRGPWVRGLVAAGYQVCAIDPSSVARHREHDATPGAPSDVADAHLLADVVRLDRAHHRRVDGDGLGIEGLRPVASIHQSLIWDRERQVLRLRGALQEFFPAALTAFEAAGLDLTSPAALELLGRAPEPDLARHLSRSKITAALNGRAATCPRHRRVLPGAAVDRRHRAHRRPGGGGGRGPVADTGTVSVSAR